MAYDPRAICNLILDASRRRPITHVALQKLLYFSHGLHLLRTGEPLVTGYFEAWKHGPVHPGAYKSFKNAGGDPINFRAVKRDALTGEETPILPNIGDDAYNCIVQTVANYGNIRAWTLVDISHAPGAPWQIVVEQAKNTVAFGMRIPNSLIQEKFNQHKVSVGEPPRQGEPNEEAPIDFSNRSGSDRATF
jgi:uncharacterized phage-associated protein